MRDHEACFDRRHRHGRCGGIQKLYPLPPPRPPLERLPIPCPPTSNIHTIQATLSENEPASIGYVHFANPYFLILSATLIEHPTGTGIIFGVRS